MKHQVAKGSIPRFEIDIEAYLITPDLIYIPFKDDIISRVL